jgi:probable rRNA maturation factor
MAPDGLQVVVGGARGRAAAAPGLARWLARVAPVGARGTVGIAIVSDNQVRALNREYRGLDYATDVLSFPVSTHSRKPRTQRVFLGDIAIARGIARRQARAAGHSERTELRVLALHGLLHLLGYDHERDQGQMDRVEQRLRRKGGLREGLIERARPSTRSLRSGRAGSGRAGLENARGERVEPRPARVARR